LDQSVALVAQASWGEVHASRRLFSSDEALRRISCEKTQAWTLRGITGATATTSWTASMFSGVVLQVTAIHNTVPSLVGT
jgi:hypothetical protein